MPNTPTSPRTLTIIAAFTAKPGAEGRLRDELDAMIAPSLAEEGCLGYQPYADPARADRMVIVEEWVDEAALAHHFTLPHFKRVAAALDEILAEPFTLRRLADVAELSTDETGRPFQRREGRPSRGSATPTRVPVIINTPNSPTVNYSVHRICNSQ